MNQTWSSKENLGIGISVYRDVFTKDLNIIEDMIGVLENPLSPYSWKKSYVGDKKEVNNYRNSNDFKFRKSDIRNDSKESKIIKDVWQTCYDKMIVAVDDYIKEYKMNPLQYWEVMNFIKYEPGQYFETHCDHGFTYNSTTSLVGYLNDDYEGGELYFPLQDLTIKPKIGDLYIFPSTYVYPHKAMPVKDGLKYSLVTMLDHNPKWHYIGKQ